MNKQHILFLEELLVEFSFPKNKVESKISNQAETIMEHLIKIMFFDSPRNNNDWFRTIINCIATFQNIKIKPGNKSVTSKEYYNWLFDWNFALDNHSIDINGLTKRINQILNDPDYVKLKKRFNQPRFEIFVNNLISFYKELIEYLTKEEVTKNVVITLVRKYFQIS